MSTISTPLPHYPPPISDRNSNLLTTHAVDWALAHGLVVRTADKDIPSVTHAPFALFPSPFPRKAFEQALHLQPLFNELVHNVARDHAFITETMESLSKVDDFTGRLYDIYRHVHQEGIAQPVSFGLHRSDYLLHVSIDKPSAEPIIQQVELNTIASSFSSLSHLTHDLHTFLAKRTGFFNDPNLPSPDITEDALPENSSLHSIARGIAKAWDLYAAPEAVAVMIVQPGERNAFDQRWIEYRLFEDHKVPLIRCTLEEINDDATLEGSGKQLMMWGHEVAVVYYRAGYAPTDYLSKKDWDARLLIERSKAVKCPNIAYHLAGTKKVQQILSKKGMLERFVRKAADAEALRASFTGLYELDDTPEGRAAVEMALRDPARFVMKPQREGGGNNIYGEDITAELTKLSVVERNAFILMDLIRPPPLTNVMVRHGKLITGEVISELGIYGLWISDGDKVIVNEHGGHLMRTKAANSNEGEVDILSSSFLMCLSSSSLPVLIRERIGECAGESNGTRLSRQFDLGHHQTMTKRMTLAFDSRLPNDDLGPAHFDLQHPAIATQLHEGQVPASQDLKEGLQASADTYLGQQHQLPSPQQQHQQFPGPPLDKSPHQPTQPHLDTPRASPVITPEPRKRESSVSSSAGSLDTLNEYRPSKAFLNAKVSQPCHHVPGRRDRRPCNRCRQNAWEKERRELARSPEKRKEFAELTGISIAIVEPKPRVIDYDLPTTAEGMQQLEMGHAHQERELHDGEVHIDQQQQVQQLQDVEVKQQLESTVPVFDIGHSLFSQVPIPIVPMSHNSFLSTPVPEESFIKSVDVVPATLNPATPITTTLTRDQPVRKRSKSTSDIDSAHAASPSSVKRARKLTPVVKQDLDNQSSHTQILRQELTVTAQKKLLRWDNNQVNRKLNHRRAELLKSFAFYFCMGVSWEDVIEGAEGHTTRREPFPFRPDGWHKNNAASFVQIDDPRFFVFVHSVKTGAWMQVIAKAEGLLSKETNLLACVASQELALQLCDPARWQGEYAAVPYSQPEVLVPPLFEQASMAAVPEVPGPAVHTTPVDLLGAVRVSPSPLVSHDFPVALSGDCTYTPVVLDTAPLGTYAPRLWTPPQFRPSSKSAKPGWPGGSWQVGVEIQHSGAPRLGHQLARPPLPSPDPDVRLAASRMLACSATRQVLSELSDIYQMFLPFSFSRVQEWRKLAGNHVPDPLFLPSMEVEWNLAPDASRREDPNRVQGLSYVHGPFEGGDVCFPVLNLRTPAPHGTVLWGWTDVLESYHCDFGPVEEEEGGKGYRCRWNLAMPATDYDEMVAAAGRFWDEGRVKERNEIGNDRGLWDWDAVMKVNPGVDREVIEKVGWA
ncbi:hypothetical protein HKX48_004752 [Thoreauomyces humboldtii]|nr:hypothetical protein HKX48_004752 [Thoreauomyces humboldtii]